MYYPQNFRFTTEMLKYVWPDEKVDKKIKISDIWLFGQILGSR